MYNTDRHAAVTVIKIASGRVRTSLSISMSLLLVFV